LQTKGVRRISIVNARGTLLGVVRFDDPPGMLADTLSALARVPDKQLAREAGTRAA
jgi:hypothetical protein